MLNVQIGFYWVDPRVTTKPEIIDFIPEALNTLWLPQMTFTPMKSINIISGTSDLRELVLRGSTYDGRGYLTYTIR